MLKAVMSLIATDPAIPAEPELPPAEAPQATMLLACASPLTGSAGVTARIEMPSPEMVDPLPMVAILLASTTLSATPAPMLTFCPLDEPTATAEPTAMISVFNSPTAPMTTAPAACSDAP